MKGDLIYTDGKLKVVVKRRYAYYYNLKGEIYGRGEVDPSLFTLLAQAGFKQLTPLTSAILAKQKQEKILLPDLTRA